MTCKMDSSIGSTGRELWIPRLEDMVEELIEKGDWREKEAGCRWGPLQTKWDPILLLAES